jgi:hypothetical protein
VLLVVEVGSLDVSVDVDCAVEDVGSCVDDGSVVDSSVVDSSVVD